MRPPGSSRTSDRETAGGSYQSYERKMFAGKHVLCKTIAQFLTEILQKYATQPLAAELRPEAGSRRWDVWALLRDPRSRWPACGRGSAVRCGRARGAGRAHALPAQLL